MKKLFLFFSIAAMAFASCSKGDGGSGSINVTDGQTNQTVYADNTSGSGGVSFRTTGAWTSSIEDITGRAGGGVSWISIDPDHGDAAGTYTINIALEANYTGEQRTATISINCGGQTIKITITQQPTTVEGVVPEIPRLVTGIVESAVFNSDYYGSGSGRTYNPVELEFKYEASTYRLKELKVSDRWNDYSYTYDYSILGEIRITEAGDGGNQWAGELNGQGYVYSIPGEFESPSFTYTDGYLARYTPNSYNGHYTYT